MECGIPQIFSFKHLLKTVVCWIVLLVVSICELLVIRTLPLSDTDKYSKVNVMIDKKRKRSRKIMMIK